ncbi:MAG: DUF3995 domain-containing protein [Thermoanaerobaculia bacterium]
MKDAAGQASTRARVLGIILAAVFVVLAGFHVLWAIAGVPTGVQVVPSVPGGPVPTPRAASCLAVAVALTLAAVVVLSGADVILSRVSRRLRTVAGSVLGSVFVLRAVGDFRFVGFFKSITETNFAFWDTRLYTPLSLAIGLGTLWLVYLSRVSGRNEELKAHR